MALSLNSKLLLSSQFSNIVYWWEPSPQLYLAIFPKTFEWICKAHFPLWRSCRWQLHEQTFGIQETSTSTFSSGLTSFSQIVTTLGHSELNCIDFQGSFSTMKETTRRKHIRNSGDINFNVHFWAWTCTTNMRISDSAVSAGSNLVWFE